MTTNKKVYKCEICGRTFIEHPNPKTPMENLKQHIRNVEHTTVDVYTMQYLLKDVVIDRNTRLQCQISF